MNGRKVSVILPVYNGEDNIAKAIDSVLKQTYKNIELVIVNDCSTDHTQQILDEWAGKDSRIKLVMNPCNLKLPKTLNAGFAIASGEYLTWTSDDNLYKENAIGVMAKYLDEHIDVGMVYTDYTNIDARDEELGEFIVPDADYMPFGNPVGACFMYRKEVADKVGEYDASLFLAEDYDYWIRIWRETKVAHLSENLYFYRRHEKSLSETRKEQIGRQTYKVLEKHFVLFCSRSKTKEDKYRFFDHMIKRADNDKEVIETLRLIDAGYEKYKKISAFKLKIKKMLGMR